MLIQGFFKSTKIKNSLEISTKFNIKTFYTFFCASKILENITALTKLKRGM